ncbi:MAG TPA: heme-binding protein [Candidatus Sulfotelmatobacter sp.]|jgi:uncharacterized protein GlcG (DUF336 family)|nr:heme-binding protein [Candidatus Sulfotelmatobacter sp.]
MTVCIRQDCISTQAALAAVQAAVKAGTAMGCKVNVAVVDAGGRLLAFLRENGAFLHSVGIAQDKAFTAVSFGMPTATLYDLIKDNPALRDGMAQRERLVAFAGGFPIRRNGGLIGGIGVSGASEEQDCLCAQAGLDAIKAFEQEGEEA